MNLFLRVTFGCFLILTVLCLVAVLPGHRASLKPLVPELTDCDEGPCFLGIKPTYTQYAASLHTLQDTAALTLRAENLAVHSVAPQYDVQVFPIAVDGIHTLNFVANVELTFRDSTITAGDVALRYGAPCYLLPLAGITALIYPHMWVFFDGDRMPFPWRAQLTTITLNSPFDDNCKQFAVRRTAGQLRWRGFGDYRVVAPPGR